MNDICEHGTAEIETKYINFFIDGLKAEIQSPIENVILDHGGNDGLNKQGLPP
jgi:hypothetical protein